MPKWRLTADHFIAPAGYPAPTFRREGEIIEYSGVPSLNMVPLDREAEAILAEYEQRRGKKGRLAHGEVGWTGRRPTASRARFPPQLARVLRLRS